MSDKNSLRQNNNEKLKKYMSLYEIVDAFVVFFIFRMQNHIFAHFSSNNISCEHTSEYFMQLVTHFSNETS